MNSVFSPKTRRNISRIIPFGIIWLVMTWILDFNDHTLTGSNNLNPETDITLTIPIFFFASIAVFIVGLIVGTLEMVVFEKRFTNFRLLSKIGIKFLVYTGFLLIIISITYPLAEGIDAGLSPLHPDVLNKFLRFLKSNLFLNTVIQLSFLLIISLIYAAISENLGHSVFINFFTGKYHSPKVEHRIFMFLDMKESTTIAEKLGHTNYFSFLQQYYEVMSDPIINNHGEVYQYIGDEVVVTWNAEKGIENQHCLTCYKELKKAMHSQRNSFKNQFDVYPDFKAGMHIGDVTIGEIGALKKEIVFSGDVLNTTARIQSLSKELGHDLILSEDLKLEIANSSNTSFEFLKELTLRGKGKPTKLFTLG